MHLYRIFSSQQEANCRKYHFIVRERTAAKIWFTIYRGETSSDYPSSSEIQQYLPWLVARESEFVDTLQRNLLHEKASQRRWLEYRHIYNTHKKAAKFLYKLPLSFKMLFSHRFPSWEIGRCCIIPHFHNMLTYIRPNWNFACIYVYNQGRN